VPASDAVGLDLFDVVPSVTGTDYEDAIDRGLAAEDAPIRERPDETVPGVPEAIRIHPGEGGVTVHTVSAPPEQRRDARLLEELLSGLLGESGNVVDFKDEESRFVRVSPSKARERVVRRRRHRGDSDERRWLLKCRVRD